jgi:hypothetical protein
LLGGDAEQLEHCPLIRVVIVAATADAHRVISENILTEI